jgi:hypothetical protein
VAKQLQLRKGTATEHNTFTGANGEVTVDTTNKTLRVHDGTTAGGTQLATLTGGLVPATQLPAATTSVQGAVILNNTLTSTSTTQALTAAQGKVLKDSLDAASFGVGQTWKDLTSSRASGVTYTNTTGKPIQIYIMTGTESAPLIVGGVTLPVHGDSMPQIIVPHTVSYRFDGVVFAWAELR